MLQGCRRNVLSFHSWSQKESNTHRRSKRTCRMGQEIEDLTLPLNRKGGVLDSPAWVYLSRGNPNSCYWRGVMLSGFQAVIFGSTVEYVLNAALDCVKFGLCSFNSQGLTPVFRIGSSIGGLSTIYDIHACHPGSICPASNSDSL